MIRLLVNSATQSDEEFVTVDIANHDGSTNLSLVRAGTNGYGWTWNSSRSDSDRIEYEELKPKSQRITIHTIGRVNYHVLPNAGVDFIPCLLDLAEAVPFEACRCDCFNLNRACRGCDHTSLYQPSWT